MTEHKPSQEYTTPQEQPTGSTEVAPPGTEAIQTSTRLPESLNTIFTQLTQQQVEQFEHSYQLWSLRRRIAQAQHDLASIEQQIEDNASLIETVQPSPIALAILARLQASGVNDLLLLDRMLDRGDTWLDHTAQLLERCEKLDLIRGDYTRWCENALEGAYDWLDSMSDEQATQEARESDALATTSPPAEEASGLILTSEEQLLQRLMLDEETLAEQAMPASQAPQQPEQIPAAIMPEQEEGTSVLAEEATTAEATPVEEVLPPTAPPVEEAAVLEQPAPEAPAAIEATPPTPEIPEAEAAEEVAVDQAHSQAEEQETPPVETEQPTSTPVPSTEEELTTPETLLFGQEDADEEENAPVVSTSLQPESQAIPESEQEQTEKFSAQEQPETESTSKPVAASDVQSRELDQKEESQPVSEAEAPLPSTAEKETEAQPMVSHVEAEPKEVQASNVIETAPEQDSPTIETSAKEGEQVADMDDDTVELNRSRSAQREENSRPAQDSSIANESMPQEDATPTSEPEETISASAAQEENEDTQEDLRKRLYTPAKEKQPPVEQPPLTPATQPEHPAVTREHRAIEDEPTIPLRSWEGHAHSSENTSEEQKPSAETGTFQEVMPDDPKAEIKKSSEGNQQEEVPGTSSNGLPVLVRKVLGQIWNS